MQLICKGYNKGLYPLIHYHTKYPSAFLYHKHRITLECNVLIYNYMDKIASPSLFISKARKKGLMD